MPLIGEIRKAKDCNQRGHCKYIWHACTGCGRERWVVWKVKLARPRSDLCMSCGLRKRGLQGEKSPSWEGGRCITKAGYIWIWVAPSDFFHPMANHHSYVLEHRLVMAKHLKRCLLPWEVVHHRDGGKGHNELRNLELISGQKYHIVDGAVKQYIKRLQTENKKILSKLNELAIEIRLLRLENKQLKGGETTLKRYGRGNNQIQEGLEVTSSLPAPRSSKLKVIITLKGKSWQILQRMDALCREKGNIRIEELGREK
jgi:hypothetical protein